MNIPERERERERVLKERVRQVEQKV